MEEAKQEVVEGEENQQEGEQNQVAQTMTAEVPNPKQQLVMDSKSLYIGNLSPVVNQALLYEVFAAVGPIAVVKVITDKVVWYLRYCNHYLQDGPEHGLRFC